MTMVYYDVPYCDINHCTVLYCNKWYAHQLQINYSHYFIKHPMVYSLIPISTCTTSTHPYDVPVSPEATLHPLDEALMPLVKPNMEVLHIIHLHRHQLGLVKGGE